LSLHVDKSSESTMLSSLRYDLKVPLIFVFQDQN